MKKTAVLVVGVLILIAGLFLFVKPRFLSGSTNQAVLKVNSNPEATVFLDNQNLGKTPLEIKYKPGSYTLKIVPETTVAQLLSWEGKVDLNANLLTFVNRDLGESELKSGGEILSLESVSGRKAEIAVVSKPDATEVTLGTESKGTAPLVLSDVEPGNYDLTVAATGYTSRTVKVKATSGYKLTANFQLVSSDNVASPGADVLPESTSKPSPSSKASTSPKPSASAKASASPSAAPSSKKTATSPPPVPYVKILDTPTGFLRVRSEPSTSTGEEVARVNPGEYYSLLDEQESSGTVWYKIEYATDKAGWVSGQYADKFE